MSDDDRYRDWDGAYVLGSLSPAERAEYEQHLATCDDCSRDVAELAGMGALLAGVPADRAMALVDADAARPRTPPTRLTLGPTAGTTPARGDRPDAIAPPATPPDGDVPPALLPRVIELATYEQARRRRRRGAVVAAVIGAAACVALAVSVALPRYLGDDSRSPAIVLAQTVSSPITAEAVLIEEPWGTTIEVTCWYSADWSPPPGMTAGATLPYDLYITDTDGVATKQASWSASPGMVATPSATTLLTVDQIARIDIRVTDTDIVLLDVEL